MQLWCAHAVHMRCTHIEHSIEHFICVHLVEQHDKLDDDDDAHDELHDAGDEEEDAGL